MAYNRPIWKRLAGIIVAGVLLATRSPEAADIQLDDGTVLKGDVARVEDEMVLLRLPRTRIKSVNGRVLSPALTEGVPAPVFSVTDISGKKRSIGTETKRVTVLHFWVHWCPHCRSDAPQLQNLFDQFGNRPDVQFLTVNLDQDRAKVEQFIADHKVTYPIIFAKEQTAAPDGVDLAARYEVAAFPITFVIDRQGIIRRKIVGSFAESDTDLTAIINQLL